jgi:hypothetical protein
LIDLQGCRERETPVQDKEAGGFGWCRMDLNQSWNLCGRNHNTLRKWEHVLLMLMMFFENYSLLTWECRRNRLREQVVDTECRVEYHVWEYFDQCRMDAEKYS